MTRRSCKQGPPAPITEAQYLTDVQTLLEIVVNVLKRSEAQASGETPLERALAQILTGQEALLARLRGPREPGLVEDSVRNLAGLTQVFIAWSADSLKRRDLITLETLDTCIVSMLALIGGAEAFLGQAALTALVRRAGGA